MLEEITQRRFQQTVAQCSDRQLYQAALELCREKMKDLPRFQGERKLYYLSAEFLMGKLLVNNLINTGLYGPVQAELQAAGRSLAQLEDAEPEPSLGNGGLGRLAACFLDSIATLGLPGDGVGLCYRYGLFRQEFHQNQQWEQPNPWLEPESWLEQEDVEFTVPFGELELQAQLYSLDVPGYGANGKNRLRLFDLKTVDPSMVHDGIQFDKEDIARNLTLFLYPDDSDQAGRALRVYQQYFMVSCAAQLILKELEERGHSLRDLDRYTVIQINDTHPSMVIPELVRLMARRGIPVREAAGIVARTCAYTNHTILAEALEKWPLKVLQTAVPQLVPVILELDRMAKERWPQPELAILDSDGLVHMARMDLHYGFSVNGVAELHTEILKQEELRPFYQAYPEKFNNKTNGITFRRWLTACDPELDGLITSCIGVGWKTDAGELKRLEAFAGDSALLERLLEVKAVNKQKLADYLQKVYDVKINTNSIFDVQIKRLHEYKRQQMNLLYIIWKYRQIQAGRLPARPITFLFGAKAAPAYVLAKDISHALLCLAQVIRQDEQASPWLKLVFVENYNVAKAERLVPAADVSEQISLASKEASGTGNMKLMLNGAVTLGTLDGANVEIAERVGRDNIYLFGAKSSEVIRLYSTRGYHAAEYYARPEIEPLVDFLLSKPMLRAGDAGCLGRLYQDLTHKDWFMTLLDLEDYIRVKEKMLADYEDRTAWARRMLYNIANAGFFSSDRTIAEYDRDIWHLGPGRFPGSAG